MEFSVLPRAKFYSTKSYQSTSTSNNQTVNININDKKEEDIKTNETKEEEEQTGAGKLNEPNRTIEFLKLLLEAHLSNPIKYNGLVVCSTERLQELIQTLVGCEEVVIETEDLDLTCCGTKQKFIPISKIWIRNGEVSEVFKYKYSQYLEVFDAYKISLKFLYVE